MSDRPPTPPSRTERPKRPARAAKRTLAAGLAALALLPGARAEEPRHDEAAFAKTFHHGVAVVNGVRIHYVEGGQGEPLVLVPGWPESWYAWRHVMPLLAAHGRHVVAVDPRGMGDSDHPAGGYDARTVASDLHQLVAALHLAKDGQVDVAGHDVGAWIAYAWAADWPHEVRRLALMEAALPGVTPPAPAGIPNDAANLKTWHFSFNRIPDLPEVLVQGHERAYLAWLFQQKATKTWAFPPEALDEYTRVFAQPGGARAAFSYYRTAFGEQALQENRERAARQLEMPVLAIGGQYGVGNALLDTMKGVATDVRGAQLAGCGHFVLEECPADVSRELLQFLAAP